MKHFSAQYIITNSGPVLKRGIISTDDNGTVVNIEDTGGDLKERQSVEYHNGIIIPGFVNSHCHLELSHMKASIEHGKGLSSFIEWVRNNRSTDSESTIKAANQADRDMYASGVNLCADICNTPATFRLKRESRIKYLSLLEVFGIDSSKAEKRLNEVKGISEIAAANEIPFSIVPHSVYSLSLTLFRLLRKETANNRVTSIHFMETAAESELVENHSGPIMNSYIRSGLISSGIETVKSHHDAVLNEITPSGNLILVHNTFVDRQTIMSVKARGNIFWCLCPKSNIFIENKLPPADLLVNEGCDITIGTDSLASNTSLDMLEELKALQAHFTALSIPELVLWATYNGAKALGMENEYGKIETGKKPGLLLLQDVDLQNMKLLPESFVIRLI
jgi:aminodeoxyfutalosine deaminase